MHPCNDGPLLVRLGGGARQRDLSLKRAYTNAAETSGEVKVRKSIMQALATQEKTELTFREVRAAFQKIHRNYDLDSLGFINVGLGDLVGKYRVLQSRGRPKSPNRTYRFANPLMRTYVLREPGRTTQLRRGRQVRELGLELIAINQLASFTSPNMANLPLGSH